MKSRLQGKQCQSGTIVCKNIVLTKKLGTGAFGQIYLAISKTNQNQRYAAKLENKNTKYPQLNFQAKLYKYFNYGNKQIGIPQVYSISTQGDYNVMIMQLLGKSIQDLFIGQNKRLSLKTVLMLGQQMIDRIQFMHNKLFLHRDIKPDNFLMGLGSKKSTVYIVDMGLAKKFIKDGQHIPYKDNKELTGTARYASINTHMGIEQGKMKLKARRDDLQSLGYVMLYLLKGCLPWQNMNSTSKKDKYCMIMQKKKSTPLEILCSGQPSQFINYLKICRRYKFQEQPDYQHLKNLLKDAMTFHKFEYDYIYDWTKGNSQQTKELKDIIKKINGNNQKLKIRNGPNNQSYKKNNNSLLKELELYKRNKKYNGQAKDKNSSVQKIKFTSQNSHQNKTNELIMTLNRNKINQGPKISIIK